MESEEPAPAKAAAQTGASQEHRTLGIILMVAGTLFVAAIFGTIWWRNNAPLWECDALVKETLKAPSTYRRIAAECNSATCDIEYDAANSFGVPIRGKGYCTTFDGKTTWYEPPKGME